MPNPADKQRIQALLAQVWEEKKEVALCRIGVVEQALFAFQHGRLMPEMRSGAAMEAHKLAGALGTFGFAEGSRLSQAIEVILKQGTPLDSADADRLARLIADVRRELHVLAPATTARAQDTAEG